MKRRREAAKIINYNESALANKENTAPSKKRKLEYTTPKKKALLSTPKHGAQSVLKKYGLKVKDDEDPMYGKYASVYAATVVSSPSPFTPNTITDDIFSIATPTKRINFQSPNVMVKVQVNKQYKNANNICLREMDVNRTLVTTLGQKCNNFVRMYAAQNTNTGIEEDEGENHMIYVMERADESLREYISRQRKQKSGVTPGFLKSCLLQLLFVLHLAQTSCEFQHNDLHFKNVLLKKLKDNVTACAFHAHDRIYLTRERYMVKIADFGLSRIKLPNGNVVYNEKTGDNFMESHDLNEMYIELKSLKINWKDIEDKEQRAVEQSKFNAFKRLMAKGIYGPGHLLKHEYFDSCIVEDNDSLYSSQVLHFGSDPTTSERDVLQRSISRQINDALLLSPDRKRLRFEASDAAPQSVPDIVVQQQSTTSVSVPSQEEQQKPVQEVTTIKPVRRRRKPVRNIIFTSQME